jgi:hypothetical protein
MDSYDVLIMFTIFVIRVHAASPGWVKEKADASLQILGSPLPLISTKKLASNH